MPRKKTKTLQQVKIDAYAAEGKSIAHLEDGKVLFVTGAIPGDEVDVRIIKDKKSWAEGRITSLVTPSPYRIQPFCDHFGICGGCKWQMLPYKQQLVYKQQQVQDQLLRIGQIALPEMLPIIGSPRERHYRNKLEFTFSAQRYRTYKEIEEAGNAPFEDEPALGFHAPGLFDKVVPIDTCHLQDEPTNRLLDAVRNYTMQHQLSYYHFREQHGWLRNMILRVTTTGEVLINMVLSEEKTQEREALLEHILAAIPEVTSLHYTINPKVNDTIYDLEVHTYAGKGFIEERLDQFRFKISPKSFFQTNSYQAATLYRKVRELAGLTGTETLYDLYCGTGSIGIFCSEKAKRVIGIEVIADAIRDAKENAAINKLDHCRFYTGDVAELCSDSFFKENGKPDVIITDPPRVGMHEKLVRQLLQMRAPKLVYVSCNPATQARDLQLLDSVYIVTALQPVDMFPHTHHIENIALLELRQGK